MVSSFKIFRTRREHLRVFPSLTSGLSHMSPCAFRRYGPTNHFDTVGHVRVCRALHVWLQGRPPQIAAMAAQKKGDAGDVDDFFAFLQCQVHMEAKRQGCEASALPPTGMKIWQDVAPWIGRTGEKWVPYHLRLFGERIFAGAYRCRRHMGCLAAVCGEVCVSRTWQAGILHRSADAIDGA